MTTAVESPKARTVDMKLEIVVIPVSDVDRAKEFYASLGWRLDADFAAGEDFRVIGRSRAGAAARGGGPWRAREAHRRAAR